jgi:hypothetical protein
MPIARKSQTDRTARPVPTLFGLPEARIIRPAESPECRRKATHVALVQRPRDGREHRGAWARFCGNPSKAHRAIGDGSDGATRGLRIFAEAGANGPMKGVQTRFRAREVERGLTWSAAPVRVRYTSWTESLGLETFWSREVLSTPIRSCRSPFGLGRRNKSTRAGQ